MEFNSIDAQREAAQAYILSQAHDGWTAIEPTYEDPGFSGGTLRRPALMKLLGDIQLGKVGIVVVHKIDRLTRSLRDFSQIITLFEAFNVSIVAVTQQFNTTSSMGRLTLNMMLSFAQFEREICSERLKDKIAASKKKGIWTGGMPPLGYCCVNKKLVIDVAEASLVREIFTWWIEHHSALFIASELERRGIRTKRRLTVKGRILGDRPFTMKSVYRLLQDPAYIGLVKHKANTYPGQHPAIIDQATWDKVQSSMKLTRVPANRPTNCLLSGLLFSPTGEPFYFTYTKKGHRRYGYYISRSEIRFGSHKKTATRIPAASIESVVAQEICKRLRSSEFIANMNQALRDQASKPSHSVDQPLLAGVLHKSRAIWDQLAATEQHKLAKALIVRIDLGLPDTLTSLKITWRSDPFTTTEKESHHVI